MAAQFEYEVELDSADSPGPWVPLEFVENANFTHYGKVHGKVTLVLITLSPSPTGTGYIETTTEPLDKVVETPGDLHPVTWGPGSVSTQTQSIAWAPTAIRVVCTSGTIHVSARGI